MLVTNVMQPERNLNEVKVQMVHVNVVMCFKTSIFNLLKAELNPVSNLLALLGAHYILHVSRIRVNVPE